MFHRAALVTTTLLLTSLAVGADLDPALLAGLEARSIGPAGMSGRMGSIEAVESDPDVIYIGAASGGVWKSTNGGQSWTPVFDDQPVHSIGAVAVFQRSPEIVWVGTGEGSPRNSVSVGNGVYRSMDGGVSWKHLGLEKSERIHRIILHPDDPDVAWVCALGQMWGENPERGVFKTTDGGRSWTKILYTDSKTGCADLAIDPSNPDKLFAALWEYRRWPWFFKSGGPGSGLYVTYDGGESWKRFAEEDGMPAGDLGRIGVAISRSYPNVVYALVEAEKSALLRSTDGGRSWETRSDASDVAGRPFYYADIRVDPEWPNRVYNLASRVRVSDDGGRTFERLPGSRQIHGDYQAMWIDPHDAAHLFLGNDGGLAVSFDRGTTFRFVSNLPLGQFYHIAVDDDDPYHVYGGMQDNGSWRGPAEVRERGGIRNHQWQNVGFGDGFDTRPDPENSRQGYAMWQEGGLMRWNLDTREIKSIKPPSPEGEELRFNWNAGLALDPFHPGTIYYGSQFVHRSTDRGDSWTVISPDLTTDNPEWQKQGESGGLTPDVTGAENFTSIVAIAPSPLAEGLLWVGTDDGRLWVTRDGGEHWTSLEARLPSVPKNTWIPHIEPSRHDPAEAFVVLDNHRRSDWTPYVLRTRDYGVTWTSLATPEVRGYALSIVQDPVEPNLLFLGTEFGLWVSLDGGGHWMRWTHGLPTASVMDLAIQARESDLVVGTHGRAVYVIDDYSPLRELASADPGEFGLFPVLPTRLASYSRGVGGFGAGATEFRGENEPYGALIDFWVMGEDLPHPDEEIERQRKEAERRVAAVKATAGPAAEKKGRKGKRAGAEKHETTSEPASVEKGGEGGEKAAKATLEIRNAAGELVRKLEPELHQGLNRVVWDLGRDPFKRPGEGGFFGGDSGPGVPPGAYTVTLKWGGHEASQAIEVAPPDGVQNSAADWQAREAFFHRAAGLLETLTEAVERIQRTRTDAELLVERAQEAKKKAEEAAGDEVGSTAAGGAGEEAEAETPEDPLEVVIDRGRKLATALTELEDTFWDRPGTKGIRRRSQIDWSLNYPLFALRGSWSAPTATDRENLDRGEAKLAEALQKLNELFAEDVAAFRGAVRSAGLELLPEQPPVELGSE